ncbi:glutamine synthetase family protein [Thalassobium sp. R2A62]|jgi:glutamine synthetase|uniref:glutamine synthetase family protein n=1 Tax=Thalassobium sp. R2A62 TaxID=633131 RepID=UPI0001B1D790|nr:glutamine synthetase family protein [Thalassobium sp. R2A62]EET49699.1 L-glutamine synthetase [Thalassobium sp. R2A62]MDG1340234.1 glutamine synthetase family protein [Paracoccaceae bacterium]MDG1802145.1 glutamine synthetase family protein [Paracoccaceae bacterium]
MPGTLSFDDLKTSVDDGIIDTVLVCIVDMQGRLMGKRFHAPAFVDSGHKETHCCTYLLATDLEMATPDGYASTSWEQGYGDYTMTPDLTTLRLVPWLEGTAMVLCDVADHHGHLITHSPRAMLKKQIARLTEMGFSATMATELEFFLFEKSFDEIAKGGFRDLTPISAYNEDYHILQTTKEEAVMRPLRNHLYAMGIPVEGTKGEAEAGQEELNIKYAEALACADHHSISKHAVKEIAWQQGHAATFLPKWSHERVGSSSHVHQSLWKDGKPAFFDPKRPNGKSELMDHYMAGLIKYAADYTYFMAPYVNSYKRFAKGSFAPTRIIWSVDNRTAAYRLCGEGSSGIRVECRIPGSDMNPYLAEAAMLAAGIKGIEEKLPLQPAFAGDAYEDTSSAHIPRNLRDAKEALHGSDMLRAAMGGDVIDHYTRAAEWELEEFDRVVTDWEIARGFERA